MAESSKKKFKTSSSSTSSPKGKAKASAKNTPATSAHFADQESDASGDEGADEEFHQAVLAEQDAESATSPIVDSSRTGPQQGVAPVFDDPAYTALAEYLDLKDDFGLDTFFRVLRGVYPYPANIGGSKEFLADLPLDVEQRAAMLAADAAEGVRRSSMTPAIIISDDDLKLINAGPPTGRAEARMALVCLARDEMGAPIPPPIGTEFFNDGELADLLILDCQCRFNLTKDNHLGDLGLAWQSAPSSSRLAVERIWVGQLLRNAAEAKILRDNDSLSPTVPVWSVKDIPVVPIDEDPGPSSGPGTLIPNVPAARLPGNRGDGDGDDGGDDDDGGGADGDEPDLLIPWAEFFSRPAFKPFK
jgi:hypothetical protein